MDALARWAILVSLLSSTPCRVGAQDGPIADTAKKLQAVRVVDNPQEDLPYSVPSTVRPLLKLLKQQLRELIAETLNQQGAAATATTARASIIGKLERENVELRPAVEGPSPYPEADFNQYGFIQDIRVDQPKRLPNILAAVTTLQIPCGSDSSLYVFQRTEKNWKLVIAQEADDYTQVSGAQGSFDYAVSPPDKAGKWFVVTTHFHPWCTSNWNAVHIKAFRIGPSQEQPRVLLDKDEQAYRGEDSLSTLRTAADSFRVKMPGLPVLLLGRQT